MEIVTYEDDESGVSRAKVKTLGFEDMSALAINWGAYLKCSVRCTFIDVAQNM